MNPGDRDTGWVSRRKFLERVGRICAAGPVAMGLRPATLAWAAEGEDSGPVDCGPPPAAKPQHQTGGESFAPLPLPVTPLLLGTPQRR
ncbi:MAG: hypothetical protein NUV77_18400, partial [Thermoguttaceae bacterium]|nr:hypothetical protein [Thermoguttaceae bacterium]